MKKYLSLILPIFLYANSIFVDDGTNTSSQNNSNTEVFEKNDPLVDLKVVQESFLKPKNGELNSILNIQFEQNRTYRIKTRLMMNTLIILDNDKIAGEPFFGNDGFKITKLGVKKYDLSNMLLIQPKYVGIDTNLTIIGESGNIYSFYLYSTDYTSNSNPDTVVFVSEKRARIDKINIVNLEKKEFLEEKKSEAITVVTDPDYFYIGEGKNRIKVYKKQVIKDFVQDGDEELKAKEIFRDNKFVYFKYDKDYSLSTFPALFKVVDGFDSPINFRIIGDYLVAETIANSFTLKIENKHVCVRRLEEISNEKK